MLRVESELCARFAGRLELFCGAELPRYQEGDGPPPSEASLNADPWVQHDLALIPGIQTGERKGTSIAFNGVFNKSQEGLLSQKKVAAASARVMLK